MNLTIRERLDQVLKSKTDFSRSNLQSREPLVPSDTAERILVDSLFDASSSDLVVVIDESESLTVVASNPSQPSSKRQYARLVADLATYMTTNSLSKAKVIRLGSSGRVRSQPPPKYHSDILDFASSGNTRKSEKTAYLLRSVLTRLSAYGHMVIVSDFRSHMWRRTINAIAGAAPRITLVHLVDAIDCDFVLSCDEQLDLATQPDPTPWSTPLHDSQIPPSDMHAYLTAFCDINDVNLLGIIVQSSSMEELMIAFEKAITND